MSVRRRPLPRVMPSRTPSPDPVTMPNPEPVPSDGVLLAAAQSAATFAHSPYSRWRVGAAALFAETGGVIHRGANVENVSFGLTICAERSAIAAAVVAGGRRLVRLALSARDSSDSIPPGITPCGACLQVMAEFGDADTAIVIDGRGSFRLADFLPAPFSGASLARGPESGQGHGGD